MHLSGHMFSKNIYQALFFVVLTVLSNALPYISVKHPPYDYWPNSFVLSCSTAMFYARGLRAPGWHRVHQEPSNVPISWGYCTTTHSIIHVNTKTKETTGNTVRYLQASLHVYMYVDTDPAKGMLFFHDKINASIFACWENFRLNILELYFVA